MMIHCALKPDTSQTHSSCQNYISPQSTGPHLPILKQCRKEGTCGIEGYDLCVEWAGEHGSPRQKAHILNGGDARVVPSPSLSSQPIVATVYPYPDFQLSIQEPLPAKKPNPISEKQIPLMDKTNPIPNTKETAEDYSIEQINLIELMNVSSSRVAELEALNVEIELTTPIANESIFLVAARTGQPRLELTFKEVQTFLTIKSIFPDAELKQFVRKGDASEFPKKTLELDFTKN